MQNLKQDNKYFFPPTEPILDGENTAKVKYSPDYITPWQKKNENCKHIQNGKTTES